MLKRVSLNHLVAFIAVADQGSFSAAARRLYRAQSVVSELVGRLEAEMGVLLFDRSGKRPKLTKAGEVLLADARKIVGDLDFMTARAKGIAGGIEPELSVVFDVMFPLDLVTRAALEFKEAFPATPLRLHAEVLGSAYELLLDGRASLGIVGGKLDMPDQLTAEPLPSMQMAMVAAAGHPLATFAGTIPRSELSLHTQLVLTDRSALTQGKDFYVMSPSTWRLADLSAKRAFLLAGLGWGGMPFHMVEDDINDGTLVVLEIEGAPTRTLVRPMAAVYASGSPPGPAGRWLVERFRD